MTDTHIEMQVVVDENGSLMIYENFPFEMKRTFVIYMRLAGNEAVTPTTSANRYSLSSVARLY